MHVDMLDRRITNVLISHSDITLMQNYMIKAVWTELSDST